MNTPVERAPLQSWYVLVVLTAILVMSYVDRSLLAILLQPIKEEMHFSDTEIGLLTGFAFSAVYALFGIPIARISDRGVRRNVIFGCLIFWSAATAACGFAKGFWSLALTRCGVGAGEAGGLPASHSMIADLFPFEQRNTALAIFSTGGGIGIMIAFGFGGWLEPLIGWRWTFVAVAMPGLLLAAILWLSVGEPELGRYRRPELETAARGGRSDGGVSPMRDLFSNPTFRHLPLIQSLFVLLLFGQAQWLPAYIERSFDVGRAELGGMLAITHGAAGLVGMILGGVLADVMTKKGRLWPIRVAIISAFCAIPPMIGMYLAPTAGMAYAFSSFTSFFLSMHAGPVVSLLQTIVHPSCRATASATTMMVASFVGLGGGPLLIGFLSDQFTPAYGPDALRYALLTTVAFVTPWAIVHLVRVHQLIARELRNDTGQSPIGQGGMAGETAAL